MWWFFFFLSQAVWTPQKWISENVDVWRTHKRLKRFASLAELKILDVNGPFISSTVQTIICYLLILPHFMLWNHFIHLFYKYLWSGWYVSGTLLAAEMPSSQSPHPGTNETSLWATNSARRAALAKYRMVQESLEGALDWGFPRASKIGSRCWGLKGSGSWLWKGGREERKLEEQEVWKSHRWRWAWCFESPLV